MIAYRNANGDTVTANVTQRYIGTNGSVNENIALPNGTIIPVVDNKVVSAQSPTGMPVTSNPLQAATAFFTNNVMLIVIAAVVLVVAVVLLMKHR
jgi:hypothetical protein